MHLVPSPTCQLYLSPHWSSTYGTTLLAPGHSSSLSWLAPGSRRLSHCRAGTHHPLASLSACSFQPEISHIIIYTVLTLTFLQNRQQQVSHSTGREYRPFWSQQLGSDSPLTLSRRHSSRGKKLRCFACLSHSSDQ